MREFIPINAIPHLGSRTFLRTGAITLVVFNVNGTLHAINDSCPHSGASLFSGKLDDRTIQCPAHGLRFDICTGKLLGGALMCVPVYPVRTEGEQMVITLPD